MKLQTARRFTKAAIVALLTCGALLCSCQAEETDQTTASSAQTENTAAEEDLEGFDCSYGFELPTEADDANETTNAEDSAAQCITMTVNDTALRIQLEDNSSAQALAELLAQGPLTLQLSDYANMEKVGPLGTTLPTNDQQIDTVAGDVILYQGDKFVVYYRTNSYSLTRLGHVQDTTADELASILGAGDVEATLTLA